MSDKENFQFFFGWGTKELFDIISNPKIEFNSNFSKKFVNIKFRDFDKKLVQLLQNNRAYGPADYKRHFVN